MQLFTLVLGALLLLLPQTSAVDPLAKVLELLDNLASKISAEGETEAKAYEEFVEWCDDAAKNAKFELKTAESKKAKLEAVIGKAAGDAEAAVAKIEDLAGSIAASEKELKEATGVRDKESADFAGSERELMESIDAVGRAITILQREMKKNPALAQVDSTSADKLVSSISTIVEAAALASADKQKLMSLVQSQSQAGSDDDDEPLGAPAAAVYKSQSGNILDVLEDLKEKAEEELSGLRKAETDATHNYEMLKQSLQDQLGADSKDLDEHKVAKASTLQTKAAAQGDLSNTVKDIENAKSSVEVSSNHCMQIAADHEATLAARKEELEVIAKAKESLASTTSGAVGQTYSLLQVDSALGDLSQVRSKLHTRADLASIEVVALVKRLAAKHHSTALSQLASRIAAVLHFGARAGDNPFGKVKSLISDLIAKLESEAGSEATEKAYCDEQMSKTEAKKQELDADLAKMNAKIDQAASASATLKAEVQELQNQLAKLAKSQAEMDKIRLEEKEAFAQAKTDLELGLQGVRKALGMLREYYSAEPAEPALVQADQPAVPEKHAKASGAGTSIIGMLEVIESDFAKNLAVEETEEDDSQTLYDTMTQKNKITKTLMEQDVKYKTQEFKSQDKTVADLSSERATTSAELSAVLEYDSTIKARCIAKPETYEERKRRREAEISGLKDALNILQDETAFVQSRKRGGRKHAFLGN